MWKDDPPFAIHLSFNGNCKQAFNYYQTCFGGELTVQTLADTPLGARMSNQMRKAVVCATLKNAYFKLVGTDLTEGGNIVSGNNISILIECNSFDERTILINKLVSRNFCSTGNTNAFINVIDRYRINWILSVNQ
jgi:PhnB protein